MPDSGTFNYWYSGELTQNPPDGIWTGAMDHWLALELPEIYADAKTQQPGGWGLILLVNTGTPTSPIWTPIAGQRAVTFGAGRDLLDASSKASRNRRVLYGRFWQEVSVGGLYVPNGEAFQVLRQCVRNAEMVQLKRYDEGYPPGICWAVVTKITTDAPPDDAALVSLNMAVDDDWIAEA